MISLMWFFFIPWFLLSKWKITSCVQRIVLLSDYVTLDFTGVWPCGHTIHSWAKHSLNEWNPLSAFYFPFCTLKVGLGVCPPATLSSNSRYNRPMGAMGNGLFMNACSCLNKTTFSFVVNLAFSSILPPISIPVHPSSTLHIWLKILT